MNPQYAWLVLLLLVAGCVNQQTVSQDNQTAIANPASVKCVEDGGVNKILSSPQGQYGLCLFPDSSVCEEWAYYRGECAKGQCMRRCDQIGTRSEGWYDCNDKLLFWDQCVNETAATVGAR